MSARHALATSMICDFGSPSTNSVVTLKFALRSVSAAFSTKSLGLFPKGFPNHLEFRIIPAHFASHQKGRRLDNMQEFYCCIGWPRPSNHTPQRCLRKVGTVDRN